MAAKAQGAPLQRQHPIDPRGSRPLIQLVVDASVAVKWMVPEPHGHAALRLFSHDHSLHAPDLIWAEIGNALWKKWRRDELDDAEASELFRDLQRFNLEIHPCEPLAPLAWSIATRYRRPFYDCVYIALASEMRCSLVTADQRLHNALADTPLAARLQWIEDVR